MGDLWESNLLRVEHVQIEFNETNICTKNLPKALHTAYQDRIRMGSLKFMQHVNTILHTIWREGIVETECDSVQIGGESTEHTTDTESQADCHNKGTDLHLTELVLMEFEKRQRIELDK